MNQFPMLSFDPENLWHVIKLSAAFALALPAGFMGEKETHSAGLRTFPLVAMASCGYLLLAQPAGHATPDVQSRLVQGLLSGIGFIGGGAILKTDSHVHGVATAAGIFATGAMGAAIAEERWVMAALLSALTFIALRFLMPLKAKFAPEDGKPGGGPAA
jgi:putative Mg2+ transporter-C (MgtC) family protein